MTDKKHHRHKDEQVQEQVTPPEGLPENLDTPEGQAPAPAEVDGTEVASLREKLTEAEAKSAEHLDGWQRAVAEFQNYKKRIERDRESDKAIMKGDLIKKIPAHPG